MCDIVLMHELKALPIKVSMHAMQTLDQCAYLEKLAQSFNKFCPTMERGGMELTEIWHDEENLFGMTVDGYDIQDRNRTISRIGTHVGRRKMQGYANFVTHGTNAFQNNFSSVSDSGGIQHIWFLDDQG